MTERNDKNSTSRSSNDISEMLRLLRESVEADKRAENESNVGAVEDDEIKASLERIFEEVSLDTEPEDVEGVDDYEDDGASWFALGEDDDLEEEADEELLEEESKEEPVEEEIAENEDVEEEITVDEPVEEEFVEDEVIEEETVEEAVEEAVEDEIIDEEIDEEDPDNDDPWYSDEETEDEPVEDEIVEDDVIEEETVEEEAVEDEIVDEEIDEEDPDNDDPWYSDEETEDEPVEEEFVEIENTENDIAELVEQLDSADADELGWYGVDAAPDEPDPVSEDDEAEQISLDDESIWYSADEDDTDESEEDGEIYQDEEFDEDDAYDEDFDDYAEDDVEDTPEDDFDEEDVYIYDAEQEADEEDIYELVNDECDGGEGEYDENGFDQTDIGLISSLGFTDEEEEPDESAEDGSYAGDISYDYDGGEYVLENQRHEISAGYRAEKKRTLIRLIAASSLALVLLIYEMLTVFGVELSGILDPFEFPLSHIMISLQILVLCAILCAKQLYVGVLDFIFGRATPYSISAVVVMVNVIYSIALGIAMPQPAETFNFIGAFAAVTSIAYEFILLISEEHAFGVFSSQRGQKYAFVPEDALDINNSDGRISLCAYSTEFNKNYFSRMRKRSEDYKYLTYLMISVLSVSLITFVVSLICKTGMIVALKNGIMISNLALPVGALAAFSYPVFRASTKALGSRGAFIGCGAIDEYSNTRFVTFGEEELFPSLKTTHLDLKPAGNENVSEVLSKTSMLLSAIGGPMKKMVEAMQSEECEASVEINEIFDDGISAWVDGVEMLAGSAQFLELHGVQIEGVESDNFKDSDDSNEVVYVSIDGKLSARYYLKYKADVEFIKLVNALGARGISVGIRTRNPGINSDIIERRCPELKYKIYTIKAPVKNEDEAEMRRSSTDSGIVAQGKSLSLAYPLLACVDIKRYYRIDMLLRIISAALGVITVLVNVLTPGAPELSVISALLYQAVWFLPTVAFGILHFNHRSKKKKFRIVYR